MNQICLVIKMHKPLKEVNLIRNIALFSQLLMMREFEIVFWAALNTEDDINTLIKKNKDQANADQLII